MGAHHLRPGRHHRHGLNALLHAIAVNVRALYRRPPAPQATSLTLTD